MASQLWVKVMGARDLKQLDNPEAVLSPVCSLGLRSSDGKLADRLQTEAFPKSSDPDWNAEFLVTAINASAPLQLIVTDRSLPQPFNLVLDKIGRGVVLGWCEINFSVMQSIAVSDLWLDLRDGPGKLHVLIQRRPLYSIPAPEDQHVRLPMFRMTLERPSYWAGETVRATVALNVGVPLQAKTVNVQFIGWQEVGKGEKSILSTLHIFDALLPLLQGVKPGKGQPTTIASNNYIWPVQFVLPADIPPTSRAAVGGFQASITYQVRVFINCKKQTQVLGGRELRQEIRVFTNYFALPWDPVKSGEALVKSKDQFMTLNAISVSPSGPLEVVGNVARIHVRCVNNIKRKVTGLQIELLVVHSFFSSKGNRRFVDILSSGVVSQGFPLEQGRMFEGVSEVYLAPTLEVSLPRPLARLILREYFIRISCLGKGRIHKKVILCNCDVPRIVSLPPPVVIIEPPVSPSVLTVLAPSHQAAYFVPPATAPGSQFDVSFAAMPADLFSSNAQPFAQSSGAVSSPAFDFECAPFSEGDDGDRDLAASGGSGNSGIALERRLSESDEENESFAGEDSYSSGNSSLASLSSSSSPASPQSLASSQSGRSAAGTAAGTTPSVNGYVDSDDDALEPASVGMGRRLSAPGADAPPDVAATGARDRLRRAVSDAAQQKKSVVRARLVTLRNVSLSTPLRTASASGAAAASSTPSSSSSPPPSPNAVHFQSPASSSSSSPSHSGSSPFHNSSQSYPISPSISFAPSAPPCDPHLAYQQQLSPHTPGVAPAHLFYQPPPSPSATAAYPHAHGGDMSANSTLYPAVASSPFGADTAPFQHVQASNSPGAYASQHPQPSAPRQSVAYNFSST